jgi:hypothetical protein
MNTDYRIYKYQLKISDQQIIDIPINARFLCVRVQNDIPVMYWLVDTEFDTKREHLFTIVGTGHPIKARELETMHYIDSVMCHNDTFAWHIFCNHKLKE